jgi:protein SCO1/2
MTYLCINMGILNKYRKFLGIFAVVSAIILMLFYDALLPAKRLPVFQPAMVNFELVDSTIQHQKKFHRIADFSLTNQNGKTITQNDFRENICIAMTDNLLKVQKKIKNNPNVMLLSHSVTPKIDSVAQLKKYALEKGVIDQKWHLVTGDKKVIYELARKSYLAVKEDGDGGSFDMIHTENFILVDPDRRVRGFYDGTDLKEIQRLLEELEILIQEYFPS